MENDEELPEFNLKLNLHVINKDRLTGAEIIRLILQAVEGIPLFKNSVVTTVDCHVYENESEGWMRLRHDK